ncbi:hypothetical protein HDC90_001330 [Pedobacter sp. AK013]|uniref:energy transducer TonB n=1 Tax=Pedobacter sp. AK013 TaxID=2723071 RepID=UPI00160E1F46|nr:hypothetical protein [Pedobacter sp. AK013]MBB6236718.1 hypothetical protein [Pedobacter sp. AK013]
MFKLTLLFAFLLTALSNNSIDDAVMNNNPSHTDCVTKKDLLTGKMIYTTFDEPAVNKGGVVLLYRAFGKIKIDSVPHGATTKFTIAFVVDVDGSISGERIIEDEVGGVGDQMIKIVKSFKWSPAMCNGKQVASLHQIPLQICLQ